MIVSASRRTDIPAFFGEWFFNRIKEGFVKVRNPMYPNMVTQIDLSPENVDCFVFWTKWADDKFLENLKILDDLGYSYYFQYTVTGYGSNIEKNIISYEKESQFIKTAEKVGRDRIIWRYDPIFLGTLDDWPDFVDGYDIRWHLDKFEEIGKKFKGLTNQCIFSFGDVMPKLEQPLRNVGLKAVPEKAQRRIAGGLSAIAKSLGMTLSTCSEKIDLDEFGITHAHCIDGSLIEKISNKSLNLKKDRNQRLNCGCCASVDIGAYNCCGHNCVYCYAMDGKAIEQHFPDSPYILGMEKEDDKIYYK